MTPEPRTGSAPPSARERHVLELIARGFLDKEIAAELGVALPTVRVYRQRLIHKLGTKGPMQTVLVGWRKGYVDLEAIADEALAASNARLAGPKVVR